MSAIATDLLQKISPDNLKDYEGSIVLRTCHVLKAEADDLPLAARTKDDYTYVQDYIQLTEVRELDYDCITLKDIKDYSQEAKLKTWPLLTTNYTFYVPDEVGRANFFEAVKTIKEEKIADHEEHVAYIDAILAKA